MYCTLGDATAIELSQRLGAFAFLFVGVRIGHASADLAGHQAEKGFVVAVVKPVRVQPHQQHAGAPGFTLRRQRQRHGLVRRAVPRAGGQRARQHGQILDQMRPVAAEHLGVRQGMRQIQIHFVLGRRVVRPHAAAAGQAQAALFGVHQIYQRERQIVPVRS